MPGSNNPVLFLIKGEKKILFVGFLPKETLSAVVTLPKSSWGIQLPKTTKKIFFFFS